MTPAVVLGAGRSLWDDLRPHRAALQAGQLTAFAVNDLAWISPHVDHAVSHHPERLPHWLALRTRAGFKRKREAAIVAHASASTPAATAALAGQAIPFRVWPEYRAGGSSSLLAVRVALALGHPAVLVCGVPLDGAGYLWQDPQEPLPVRDYASYRKAWEDARGELQGRVTAPSGFLAALLGVAA